MRAKPMNCACDHWDPEIFNIIEWATRVMLLLGVMTTDRIQFFKMSHGHGVLPVNRKHQHFE
jgi:hypothetical protein